MTRKVATQALRTKALGRACALVLLASFLCAHPLYALDQTLDHTDIPGPAGSGQFGQQLFALENGNFVVVDPLYDAGAVQDVGAVYLYDGVTLEPISMLTGSSMGDLIGSHGIITLPDGNFYVVSEYWNNGAALGAGALTWIDAATGLSGVVSASNSLVGTAPRDLYNARVTPLSNGNHLVSTSSWSNPETGSFNAGAITWVAAGTGAKGEISAAASLVGTSAGELVGAVVALTNGNYVAITPHWRNEQDMLVGALTWANGTTGIRGAITAENSLVGDHYLDITYEWPSGFRAEPLANGNLAFSAPLWDNGEIQDAGAVLLMDGANGMTGVISSSNALVGTTTGDQVGQLIAPLENGSFVAISPVWNNGALPEAGALTWFDGETAITGAVSAQNSLVGEFAGDALGSGAASWFLGTPLVSGGLVIRSPNWNQDRGAVTWFSGATPVTGTLSSENSLVGSTLLDSVGAMIEPLENGNFVVVSPYWDNGSIANAGAITWGSGSTGITGTVSASNSLVGSSAGDGEGLWALDLTNGNYVVVMPFWNNGEIENAGAVRWVDGTFAATGEIAAADSLVGAKAWDMVGSGYVTALKNGNYVVNSPQWDDVHLGYESAITWGDGTSGTKGTVSVENSLVGPATGYSVNSSVYPLTNGNYVVASPGWNLSRGAVTFGDGTSGVTGAISAANSLVGSTTREEYFDIWPDYVGSEVYPLANGNYMVASSNWNNWYSSWNYPAERAGAITWGDGESGTIGAVSPLNSVVGTSYDDVLSWYYGTSILPNGDYVVISRQWDNGLTHDAGAITWGRGGWPVSGAVSHTNSVLGDAVIGGAGINFAYNNVHDYLIVGRPIDNTVTVVRWTQLTTHVPLPLLQR